MQYFGVEKQIKDNRKLSFILWTYTFKSNSVITNPRHGLGCYSRVLAIKKDVKREVS